MNTAELVIDCLIAHGIQSVSGVPGEENANIMMALSEKPISFITCRHEQTAAFMAGMHGRLTGIPGVCLSTLGPGVTNLMTGIAQATLDGTPLIALIGQCSTHRLHRASHQHIEAIEMLRPIVKWVQSIRNPESVPEIIAKAIKIACSGYPGAVAIELPEDIAALPCQAYPPVMLPETEPSAPNPSTIDMFLSLLKESKCPILLLGEGAVRTEADDAIRLFMDKTGLYAAYTFMGKGCIPHSHPRSLHCAGLGFRDVVLDAFAKSDLVICIGYEQIEWSPNVWNIGTPKKIIHLNTNAADVNAAFVPTLDIVGSIPCILDAINQKIPKTLERKEPYLADIQQAIESDLHQDRDDASFPMTPKSILNIVRQNLKDDSMLVSDVGAHKMWIARQYGARHSKTCFISNGFCSMGGSIPGALEAKRLYPKRQVVAICGDGGLVMSIQALFTGVMYEIPAVVLVWQDDYYGLIRWKQEMKFHKHAYTSFTNPDLVQLCKSIGCHARAVTAAEDLAPSLAWALSNTKAPTVLIVPVDYSENMRLFQHLKDREIS